MCPANLVRLEQNIDTSIAKKHIPSPVLSPGSLDCVSGVVVCTMAEKLTGVQS